MSVIELRQYTLHPGRREALVELFETELLAPQEQLGMEIIGTFRDLEDVQRFVWVRGFPDMRRRASSLSGFYGGPVWQQHREAANATMIDSDNVLLLRPAWEGSGFSVVPIGRTEAIGPGLVQIGIVSLVSPADDLALRFFSDEVEPLIEQAGARILACLISQRGANTFPALPIREGENVLVWFAGFPDLGLASARKERLGLNAAMRAWPNLTEAPEIRLLAPTRRSRLTGTSDTKFVSLGLSRSWI